MPPVLFFLQAAKPAIMKRQQIDLERMEKPEFFIGIKHREI
jgi:hypothetical protein